jgi:hypothetical protein
VEFLNDMHNCLISYFLAFERCEKLRTSMKGTYESSAPEYENWTVTHRSCGLISLLEDLYFNPIHSDLRSSYEAVEKDDITTFKQVRAAILKFLEPGYQRIVAASTNIAGFVKEKKRPSGMLSNENYGCCSNPYQWNDEFPRGVILLEDYVDAFQIKPEPFQHRAFLKSYANFALHHYKGLPAEVAVGQLNLIINNRDYCSGFELFKIAVDRQYLMIREARKSIYKWDSLNEYGCSIALKELPLLSDEMIVWDVDEPTLGPMERPESWPW